MIWTGSSASCTPTTTAISRPIRSRVRHQCAGAGELGRDVPRDTRLPGGVAALRRRPTDLLDRMALAGERTDGQPFDMRGVAIFELRDDRIAAARLYMEPVEHDGTDIENR